MKREIAEENISDIGLLGQRFNASVIIWGTAIDDTTFYPRIWVNPDRIIRTTTPVNLTSLSELADHADLIWDEVSARISRGDASELSLTQLQSEVINLKTEIADLKTLVSSGFAVSSPVVTTRPEKCNALLIGIGDYEGTYDLIGPINDVTLFKHKLESSGCDVTLLVNNDATNEKISGAIDNAVEHLDEGDTFILYFSGHTGLNKKNESSFYLSNLQPLPLTPLFQSTLSKHSASIFIVDGGYATGEMNRNDILSGAILSADPSGHGLAVEKSFDGKTFGAFTWALTQGISDEPQGLGIRIDKLFVNTSRILKSRDIQPAPAIVVGENPPVVF